MKVVIATTTFYPKMDTRAKLALLMLEEARNLFYEVEIVDGGSCKEFLDACLAFQPWPRIHEQEEKGMGPSRRQAIRLAAETAGMDGAVFWTEPEKHPMVKFISIIANSMEVTGADIVVPKRRSMDSYPTAQKATEELGNNRFHRATGHELDVFIGPRLIGPRALPYFLEYKGEYGDKWDSICVPIVRAIADGLKVIGCEVDYVHPAEQTEKEENSRFFIDKWLEQLKNVVTAIYEEAAKLGLMKKN